MISARKTLFWLVALQAALSACVEPLDLANTPCPCSKDLICCEATRMCLSPDATCSTHAPPSTVAVCERDTDCPAPELCQSWQLPEAAGGASAGPRQCRHPCSANVPCSDGEECKPSPHNNHPLDVSQSLQLLCVGHEFAASCSALYCSDCALSEVGRVFCHGNELFGCLISGHPSCGATCKKVRLRECASCTEQDGVPNCEPILAGRVKPLCEAYPCNECPPEGLARCDGAVLKQCLSAAYRGPSCDRICPIVETACPAGCATDSDGAHCR